MPHKCLSITRMSEPSHARTVKKYALTQYPHRLVRIARKTCHRGSSTSTAVAAAEGQARLGQDKFLRLDSLCVLTVCVCSRMITGAPAEKLLAVEALAARARASELRCWRSRARLGQAAVGALAIVAVVLAILVLQAMWLRSPEMQVLLGLCMPAPEYVGPASHPRCSHWPSGSADHTLQDC